MTQQSRSPDLVRRTLVFTSPTGKKLRQAAVDHDVSESAIAEAALTELLARKPEEVGRILRRHGATRRRTSP